MLFRAALMPLMPMPFRAAAALLSFFFCAADATDASDAAAIARRDTCCLH